MKTRFKIVIVIACFVIFYLVLVPIWETCNDFGADCSVWKELMLLTRPVIPGEWIGAELEWSGTPEDIESPTIERIVMDNMPFTVSMIVLPFVIIGFVVIWDKRK